MSHFLSLNPSLGFATNVGSVLAKCESSLAQPNGLVMTPGGARTLASTRQSFGSSSSTRGKLVTSCRVLNQFPALATASGRLAPDDRRAVKAALRHRTKWIGALSAVRAAADVDVADQAVQAWDMFLGARRDPGPEPVLHLEGLGGGLFTVIGGLPPALLPRQVPDTRRLFSVSMVSITCPGCQLPRQVPEGAKNTNCPQCGQEIVWRDARRPNHLPGSVEVDQMDPPRMQDQAPDEAGLAVCGRSVNLVAGPGQAGCG